MGNDYATLTQSYDGWDYYSDGTVINPDGTYYKDGVPIWSPSPVTSNDGPLMSGADPFIQGLFGLASKGLDVWSASSAGDRQLEAYKARPMAQVPVQGGSVTMLLLVGAALFLLAKA